MLFSSNKQQLDSTRSTGVFSWTASTIFENFNVESKPSSNEATTETDRPQLERNGSTLGAFLNVICVVVGTGSLNLPATFAQAGWIGILLIIIGAFIGVFSGILLIKSLNLMKPGYSRSFNQIGQAAFGMAGSIVIYFFIFIFVIGIVGDYIILAGQSFNQLAAESGHTIGEPAWKCVCAAVMWLACISLKQMSEAAWLSFLGFSTSMVAILIGIVQSFMYPYKMPDRQIVNGSGLAIAFATITLSFSSIVVMPSVEASMKKPQRWNMMVSSAMAVVAATYMLVAVAGYWAFGSQALSPFLDNLPYNRATKAAKILISLHVIFAAPILATSFALELETTLGITQERLGRWREFLLRILVRTIFFAAMCGVALGIPFFGDVMALVGAFSTSLLMCVVPVVIYTRLRGWRKISWHLWILCAGVVVIGVYTCVLGAKSAIEDLQTSI